MIFIYLFFAALIVYAIRLYIKRNEPFEPIEPKDLEDERFQNTFSYDKSWNVSNMLSDD